MSDTLSVQYLFGYREILELQKLSFLALTINILSQIYCKDFRIRNSVKSKNLEY